jgi:hypothetical protein
LELTTWTQALDQGAKSSINLIEELLTSTEFNHNCLPRFWRYLDVQGRWPTLAEWVENNPPRPAASIGSDHPSSRLSHDQDRAFIHMLYFAVLERDPDSIGLSGWSGVLAQTSLHGVISQFLNSTEYKSHQYLHYR